MRIFATGRTGSIGKHLEGVIPLRFLFPDEEANMQSVLANLECATLIHLAAMTNSEQIAQNTARSNTINVDAPVALFRAFIKSGGKRFVFASTGHIYGPQTIGHFSLESDIPYPTSLYADQKLRAENALIKVAERNEVDLTIVRIFSVFGSSMANHYLAGTVSNQISKQTSYPIIYNSEDVRDFSSPSWVANKIREFCFLKENGIIVCNIATGTPMSVRKRVLQELPQWPLDCFDGGMSNMPWLVGSNQRLNELLPGAFL